MDLESDIKETFLTSTKVLFSLDTGCMLDIRDNRSSDGWGSSRSGAIDFVIFKSSSVASNGLTLFSRTFK